MSGSGQAYVFCVETAFMHVLVLLHFSPRNITQKHPLLFFCFTYTIRTSASAYVLKMINYERECYHGLLLPAAVQRLTKQCCHLRCS